MHVVVPTQGRRSKEPAPVHKAGGPYVDTSRSGRAGLPDPIKTKMKLLRVEVTSYNAAFGVKHPFTGKLQTGVHAGFPNISRDRCNCFCSVCSSQNEVRWERGLFVKWWPKNWEGL